MDTSKFYNLVANKENSVGEFITFLDYMIDMQKYIHNKEYDNIREDYEFHFVHIPTYARSVFQVMRHDLITGVASVNMATSRMSKRIEEFTNIE